jgi:hypothetical protein
VFPPSIYKPFLCNSNSATQSRESCHPLRAILVDSQGTSEQSPQTIIDYQAPILGNHRRQETGLLQTPANDARDVPKYRNQRRQNFETRSTMASSPRMVRQEPTRSYHRYYSGLSRVSCTAADTSTRSTNTAPEHSPTAGGVWKQLLSIRRIRQFGTKVRYLPLPRTITARTDILQTRCRATRVPQEGVSDGQQGSLLTMVGRRPSPVPGHH